MRPVRRDASPRTTDFQDYKKAKPFLISRLGNYCSYCERPIVTMLAVEHIQPKADNRYPALIGRWENFLLACTNCNSTKLDKDVILLEVLLPDRDNTFAAFSYSADGKVEARSGMSPVVIIMAERTLGLVGLNKPISEEIDENGKMVAIDRVSQRMEAWMIAEDSKNDVGEDPASQAIRRCVIRTAVSTGFFSIWMKVFDGDVDIQRRLVNAFPGTESSACFESITLQPVSPAPNPDNLDSGGKI